MKPKPTFLDALFALILLVIGFYIGAVSKQYDIEQRAKTIEYLPYYQWQDIEYIIFGETQE